MNFLPIEIDWAHQETQILSPPYPEINNPTYFTTSNSHRDSCNSGTVAYSKPHYLKAFKQPPRYSRLLQTVATISDHSTSHMALDNWRVPREARQHALSRHLQPSSALPEERADGFGLLKGVRQGLCSN
jgi:hypothetical protein